MIFRDHHMNSAAENIQRDSAHIDESRPASMAIIYRSELDYISRCIHDYPNIETGGQLFGFVSEYGAPVVCYVIGPGPRSNHQTTFFNQDTEYLQSSYNELSRRYGLRYIGEWHSHHQLGLAKPSGHDARTIFRGIQRHQFRHFLLCIGNCDSAGRTTVNAFTFHLDDPNNYVHAPWKVIEMVSPYRPIADRELRHMLYHPASPNAQHGSNYVLNSTEAVMTVTPNYQDEYWLNNKANNTELKRIIDYLWESGNTSAVTPQLDAQKHVRLIVRRDNHDEQIVFGDRFPMDAPEILVSDGVHVNDDAVWKFDGDIYSSFVQYYRSCFSPKTPNDTIHKYVETVTLDGTFVTDFLRQPEPRSEGIAIIEFLERKQMFMKDVKLSTEAGSPAEGSLVFIPEESEFCYTLPYIMPASFFKGRAFNCQPCSFIVEDLLFLKPKAFYIKPDGTRKELFINYINTQFIDGGFFD